MTRKRTGPPVPETCRQQLEQMFAWLDGELTRAQARIIERHLSSCDHCGALADDLRQAIAACRMAGDCRVPRDVHRRAKARAREMLKRG